MGDRRGNRCVAEKRPKSAELALLLPLVVPRHVDIRKKGSFPSIVRKITVAGHLPRGDLVFGR